MSEGVGGRERDARDLSTREAAGEPGVSAGRVLALIAAGRLPARREETARGVILHIRFADLQTARQRKNGRPFAQARTQRNDAPEAKTQ